MKPLVFFAVGRETPKKRVFHFVTTIETILLIN